MEIDLFTFVAQVINFSILVYLLNTFLFSRITKAMDERQAKIAKDISDAEEGKMKALEEERKSALLREKIERSSSELLAKARSDADAARKKYAAVSKAEVDAAKALWYRELYAQKNDFLGSLKDRSGEFMLLAAGKALKDLADEELSQRIAEVFLKKLSKAGKEQEALLREKISASGEPLRVRSSFEIAPGVRADAERIVREKYGYSGKLDFEVNPSVCGVEIIIGGYSVAWCVRDYLKELESELAAVWHDAGKAGEDGK